MSCAGTDATQHAVSFQRWPLAEDSLGGGRGEHQNPAQGGGGVGYREEVAPSRMGCVAHVACPVQGWAEPLGRKADCNTAPSLCDGCKG